MIWTFILVFIFVSVSVTITGYISTTSLSKGVFVSHGDWISPGDGLVAGARLGGLIEVEHLCLRVRLDALLAAESAVLHVPDHPEVLSIFVWLETPTFSQNSVNQSRSTSNRGG